MFNIENMRIKQMDHLQPWNTYRLRQSATSADGTAHPEGAEFTFDHAMVNIPADRSQIHMVRLSDQAEFVFADRTRAQCRELFERLDREELRPAPPPPLKPTEEPPPADPSAWAGWLAGQPGFEAAASVLQGNADLVQDWGTSRAEGDILLAAARAFRNTHRPIAKWLADQALGAYHGWMSQATSGGEGTAMQYEIRSELAQVREILKLGE